MRKIFTLFILLLLLPVTVGAQTTANDINYNYYTWDDTNHALTWHSGTATATDVTESDTSWGENDDQEHWYVVNGDITISSRISVTGDVHLILADGCKLTANSGIQVQDDDNDISNGSSNSLTIYAQSEGDGMGVLAASGGEKNAGIGGDSRGSGGTVAIHGGVVSATSGNGAGIGGGLRGSGGTVTIHGGVVSATSGNGAGIGGGQCGRNDVIVGGTVYIYGGVVSATSGNGAGIGGGINVGGSQGGSGGTVYIYGGVVSATSSMSAGIGGGEGFGSNSPGTFSTGTDGHAFIIASSIQDQSDKGNWRGIIFEGDAGAVYGNEVTLTTDATIPSGKTLTIESGKTLTIGEGVTLMNEGRIINYGTIEGTVIGAGTVAIPLTADMIKLEEESFIYIGNAIEPKVSVSKDGITYTDTDYTVSYSDNINAGTAKVTVTPKADGDSRLVGDAVDIEFTIAKATPTITLTVPKEDDLVYDGADKKATAIVKGVENETEELTATITYYSDETCQTKVDETKNSGTYYVKASFAETKNYMAMEETASFTITKAFATLSFTKETVSATIGETVENTLTVTPEGVTVSYSSSEETVATVDASTGAITLVGTGETIITATISDPNYTGYPASYTLTVSKATLAGDEITAVGATNISIEKNGTPFKLTAIVTKDDLGTGGKWEWTSDNETVATVVAEQGTLRAATSTSSAIVKPLSVGTATITATYEDNKYVGSVTYTVTVTKPYVPDPISYYNIYVEDVCDGVEVSTSKQVVREGGSINVYVEKDTASYTFDNFKVYYKRSYYGTWDELKEGTQPGEYPIKNIWTHIYIKAEGAEEKEDPTGIESIEGVKVYTKDGSLYVQTPQREQVIIVSMTGAVVKNEEQIGLKQYHGLQPGIYIVRVGDRAYKVRLN